MNLKISKDIRTLIEGDSKQLTEMFLSGEISAGQLSLGEFYSPQEISQFSTAIMQHQLESKSLALILPYLCSMKWLSLQEACIYARKSRNTILKLISQNDIYGTKPEGSGDYIVDRESIDGYYNQERDRLSEKARQLTGRAR